MKQLTVLATLIVFASAAACAEPVKSTQAPKGTPLTTVKDKETKSDAKTAAILKRHGNWKY
jgi:hypothetical protein